MFEPPIDARATSFAIETPNLTIVRDRTASDVDATAEDEDSAVAVAEGTTVGADADERVVEPGRQRDSVENSAVHISADHVVTHGDHRARREHSDTAAVGTRERAGHIGADKQSFESDVRIAVANGGNTVTGEAIDRESEDFDHDRTAGSSRRANLETVALCQARSAQLNATIACDVAATIDSQPLRADRRQRRDRLDGRVGGQIEFDFAWDVATASHIRFVD